MFDAMSGAALEQDAHENIQIACIRSGTSTQACLGNVHKRRRGRGILEAIISATDRCNMMGANSVRGVHQQILSRTESWSAPCMPPISMPEAVYTKSRTAFCG